MWIQAAWIWRQHLIESRYTSNRVDDIRFQPQSDWRSTSWTPRHESIRQTSKHYLSSVPNIANHTKVLTYSQPIKLQDHQGRNDDRAYEPQKKTSLGHHSLLKQFSLRSPNRSPMRSDHVQYTEPTPRRKVQGCGSSVVCCLCRGFNRPSLKARPSHDELLLARVREASQLCPRSGSYSASICSSCLIYHVTCLKRNAVIVSTDALAAKMRAPRIAITAPAVAQVWRYSCCCFS
jgi:hypothetical protein